MMTLSKFRSNLYAQEACQGYPKAHWPPHRREDHGPLDGVHISTDTIGDTAMRNFRLRRCNGNKDAWLIILMRVDGQESEIAHCCITGIRPGDALNSALRTELVHPGDTIHIHESPMT